MKRYRAVLWDYPEGEPGGGGPDSTLSHEQLPKTDWYHSREAAQEAGRALNARCGYDFFVRIEEEDVTPSRIRFKKYFVVWEDWQDEQSHGKVINIPENENPVAFVRDFLSNYGDLGKYGFLVESIEEIKEGETVSEF